MWVLVHRHLGGLYKPLTCRASSCVFIKEFGVGRTALAGPCSTVSLVGVVVVFYVSVLD